MPMEDFEVKEDLGKGSFGCVVKVIRKSDGEVYAMKQVPILFIIRLNYKD
jgi:serine/threonine protein kinase